MAVPNDSYDLGSLCYAAKINQFVGSVPFSWSDSQKIQANLMSVASVNLDDFSVDHEVLCFEALYSPTTTSEDITFHFIWRDRNSGRILFDHTNVIPSSDINSWGNGWWMRCWIGKVWYEIRGACEVELTMSVMDPSGKFAGSGTFYMPVTGETIPTECKDSTVSVNFYTTSIEGRTANFNGSTSSSNPDCSIRQITWNFGDGTGSYSGFFPMNHVYSTEGPYIVTCTAEDDCCNSKTKTISIQVGETNCGAVENYVVEPLYRMHGALGEAQRMFDEDRLNQIQHFLDEALVELNSAKERFLTYNADFIRCNLVIISQARINEAETTYAETVEQLTTPPEITLTQAQKNQLLKWWTQDYVSEASFWGIRNLDDAGTLTRDNMLNYLSIGQRDYLLAYDGVIDWWEQDLIKLMTGYSLGEVGFWERLGLPVVDDLFAWLADTFGVPIGPIDPATGEPINVILLIGATTVWEEAPAAAGATVNALAKAAQKHGVTYFDELARVDPVGTAKHFAKLTVDQKAVVMHNLQADDIGRAAAQTMYHESLKWSSSNAGYVAFWEALTGCPFGLKSILGAGIGLLGFGLFAPWAAKEAIEPSGFAVWAVLDSPDYPGKWTDAKAANLRYREFLTAVKGMLALAWANPITQPIFQLWYESCVNQADQYDIVIDANLNVGTLIVMCNVQGSDVYVDGVKKGVTPYEQFWDVGSYTVMVTKFKHTEDNQDLVIVKNDTTIFNAVIESTEVPPEEVCLLSITSVPSGAKIYIDGEYKFTTTPHTFSLSWGSHLIELELDGYVKSSETHIVPETETNTYSVTLELVEEPTPPPPEQATLTILSTPPGAKVYIDGVYKFVVTPFTIKLDAGSYIIRTELEGFDAIEETITLTDGEDRQYMALFEGEIPYYPPEEEVTVELTPVEYEYNCWKYRFIARDIVTGTEINAKIYIDGEDTTFWTPRYFYFFPETTYVVKFTRYGYHDAEVTINTAALPTPP